ncbi:hypothetical protein GCM10009854_49620 [Saccharopolyspora halophila]|uniref:Uncharacterized protein n=1 Tax=Saccharopolyspora halophila TaxID=405551 RepID=A0ABN3GY15_9PSEU
MADFFDRLVGPASRAVLRPRLPGPFERIEALRAEPREEPGFIAPRTPEPAPAPAEVLREVRHEVHTTDRVTFVRTEHAAPEPPRPARPVPRVETPEPASPPAPTERAPALEPAKPQEPQRIDPPPTPESPSPGVLRAEVAPAASERPRTRVAAAAARASAPKRRDREPDRAEPAVQVEIGRLEVNASRPQQRTRPEPAQRREPAVDLADYLSERANR